MRASALSTTQREEYSKTVNGILGLGGARRIVVRSLLLAAAALAIPAALFATPITASADGPGHICETFGSYCVGAPTLNRFDPVVEKLSGRLIDRDVIPNETVGGHPKVKLRFNADSTKCVAAANSGNGVVIHPCDGSGVDWGWDGTTGHDRYLNRETLLYLSGHNSLDSQFFLDCLGCTSGERQQFDFI
jgi:hypothetical protein